MRSHARPSLPVGVIPAIVTLVLLSIPLVAMQYTSEVQWDPFDFVVMGTLLFAPGSALEWLLRRANSWPYRLGVAGGVLSTSLMVWSNMAVGLIAGEGNPINGLLLAVPIVGIAGVLLARFRAAGMAFTLLAMSCSQALIAGIALWQGWKPLRHGPVDVWAPNALFILFYLGAAVMFWISASDERRTSDASHDQRYGPSVATRLMQAAAVALIGITIGAAGIYVGEADDAPGAEMLGILGAFTSLIVALKIARR